MFLKDENQHRRTVRKGLYNETRLPTTGEFELQSRRENEEEGERSGLGQRERERKQKYEGVKRSVVDAK